MIFSSLTSRAYFSVSARTSRANCSALPPIGLLFASFLGFNPIQQLLPSASAAHVTTSQYSYLTGRSFFPSLISGPFGHGLHLAFLTQDWLGNGTLAFWVVMFIVSWQFIPFHSLIYQGAVRQIPTSMYEAAMLDGAGRVRQFWSITLPQLRYVMITSSTLMIVGSLTYFDIIYIMTNGGPGNSTLVLSLDMYHKAVQANEYGYASVLAVVLGAIGIGIALGLVRFSGFASMRSQQAGAT